MFGLFIIYIRHNIKKLQLVKAGVFFGLVINAMLLLKQVSLFFAKGKI